MNKKHSIALSKLIEEFHLEAVYLPVEAEKIKINSPELDRPGLALAGFYDLFEPDRIQVIGRAEHKYLSNLDKDRLHEVLERFAEKKPKAVIITSSLEVYPDFVKTSEKYGEP